MRQENTPISCELNRAQAKKHTPTIIQKSDISGKLLSRLEKVKETGSGRWLACCPAHGDKSPSLSIKEAQDGRLLIHCFAGCGAVDILESIGLNFSDLYPASIEANYKPVRPFERWIPRDVIKALADELTLVMVAACAVAAQKPLTESDISRLHIAASRIHAAVREVGYDN